jgi:hypothetical protein
MRLTVLFLASLCLLCSLAHGQSAALPDTVKQKNAAKKPVPEIVNVDTAAKKKKEPKPPYVHQFRLGFDISRIAANIMFPSRQSYEIQADYLLRNNVYIVVETGFGKGKIEYENLKYTNTGYYIKVGVDKSFLDIVSSRDFDIGFIGLRYGGGPGKRAEATYSVPSIFGPSTSGTVPAQNYYAHWGEITGGLKVEIFKGVFAGWNARMRFLLNPGVFKELSPAFIPGYGKGDRSTAFDINFYISYAIRWGGK